MGKMQLLLPFVLTILVLGSRHQTMSVPVEADQCEVAVREIMREDRAAIVDESPTRLHATWISQECEARAGPEYIIRKYTFFENGTFQLMRHHYAEESCSIATHTVTARGVIRILGNSLLTPGASETRYQLDTVHISPLNRQVAHKLGHRVNVSCGPQARWRPYTPQLVFERAGSQPGSWQGPRYNSLELGPGSAMSMSLKGAGSPRIKSVNCLAPLGIDFDELRLVRVQRRSTGFRSAALGLPSELPKFELFLGALPSDPASKRSHRTTSLQPTALLRTDTIHNCPICGAIVRGTENSPPLLHEVVALPALIGGSWISPACESQPGGLWLRRQLRIYAADKLWSGRWDYFTEPRCVSFLYGVAAAGSYVQRSQRRIRRHDTDIPIAPIRSKRDEAEYYRQLLQSAAQPAEMADSFAAMLRGNQRNGGVNGGDSSTRRPMPATVAPSGTTELDLHIAESLLLVGDTSLARRCGAPDDVVAPVRLMNWSPSCVPHSLEAPSTLGLRARIGVDWYGQYTLQLGSREQSLWNAPLLHCGPTSLRNPLLRAHLRRSVGLRYGLFFSSGSAISCDSTLLRIGALLVVLFTRRITT
ncbi:hypothetical protein QAD02_019086 [Eretmocerus hayati]|uniref:Uncharacterized protein n=1 Tax=Eretmocerus hayati TaxID=131215 RepID=A0ACC2PJ19_9HYME|nr:hypothetical protein QAD02_019086 [Eretmocerus hayati]